MPNILFCEVDMGNIGLNMYHDSKLVDQIHYSVPKTSLDISNIDL